MDFVQRIYDFNKDNGLLDKPYSDFLESSFQIEEALEGFDYLPELGTLLRLDCAKPGETRITREQMTPKLLSRELVKVAAGKGLPGIVDLDINISNVDRLDKAIDAIVYAIGSMAKLGLNPSQIHQAINIVMDANDAKKGCPKDEHGKLMKPENFPNPEPRLQALLNLNI